MRLGAPTPSFGAPLGLALDVVCRVGTYPLIILGSARYTDPTPKNTGGEAPGGAAHTRLATDAMISRL